MAKLSEILSSLGEDGFDKLDVPALHIAGVSGTCEMCGQGYRGEAMLAVTQPNRYGGFRVVLCLNRPACRERAREVARQAAAKGERRVSRLEAMVVL